MEKNYQVWFTDKRKVELLEMEIPPIVEGSDDQCILIKSEASLISTGTELTQLESNVSEDSEWNKRLHYPVFAGYCNVGRVIEVGKNIDPSWVGKRLFSGSPHKKIHITGPKWNYWVVPEDVDAEDATFAGLATVALASIRVAQIRPGDTAVVFGAGLIGQLVAKMAKIAGAAKIFVADVSDYRLSLVPKDPCFITVNTKTEDIITKIKDLNGGRLADVVFETTSLPQLINSELKCLEVKGKLIITSNPKGPSLIDLDYVNIRALTIIGAINGKSHTPVATPADPWTGSREKPYFFELLQKKQISVKDMITRRESYKNAVEVYHSLMEDRTRDLGVILNWED